MNPRTSKGKPLATVPAAAFLCVKPTIDPSLKLKNWTIVEDSSSVSISPQNFMAPFGSLSLNMTDQSGNEANMACSIQKPSRTSSIAFTEDDDYIRLNASFSTFLVCNIDYSHIQPVWQILALYSDAPLTLERSHLVTDTPQLHYQYKQVAPTPEAIFTNIEADLRADPPWLMQDQISLQLNRTATTLNTLQIQFASDAQVTLSRSEMGPVRHKWTMILRNNNTKLEHTVLVGGTIDLDCPGQGDPAPHLEWLLADGSQVRAPYVSEDGRILIDKTGKLELQMADSFDTGIYTCISTNYADADILTYRITVVEPYTEPLRENGPHHTVFMGETLDLPCHSTGVPDASISWVLPGNTVLSQSSREKQILNGTLRILQVTPKDQGYYRCVAANPSGVDFLINQVSVKIRGPSPVEHNIEPDGSGFDEPEPTVHLKDPPAAHLLTAAPTGGEAGKQVLSTSKKHNYRDFRYRRRGDSANRRFREHRRPFPPSAQRIDPRHWAELLEKAKRKTVPQNQENSTAGPPPLVTQLLKIPGEEGDSSGMLPPDEEFMVLTTKVPSVLERTVPDGPRKISDGPVAAVITGTEVSPVVRPQLPPPEKQIDFKLSTIIEATAMSRDINPTTSSKMQDIPLLLETTRFQDADDMGRRREHLQSAPPITVGTKIKDVNAKMLSDAKSRTGIFLQSENTTDGHQPPVPGRSEPRSSYFNPHVTQKLSTSRLPSGPHSAAHSQLQIPRNNATNTPLSRRFGRWRKIWGRGRIIHPYRAPVPPRHRHGSVRPPSRGSAEESTTELSTTCPSCAPKEKLTTPAQEGATLSPPTSSPITLPKADIAGVTAAEPTTLVYNLSPSLLPDSKANVVIENTPPTVKDFSAGSTQVIPPGTAVTHAPTSVTMEKTHGLNVGYPRVSHISEAKRDSVIPSPLPGPATAPSMPVTRALTRLSRRKTPWRQIFVNNHIQTGRLKGQPTFGSRESTATVLSQTSPALPTDNLSPFHFTAHSANVVQIPSVTLAAVPHSATPAHRPGGLPAEGELPCPPVSPALRSSSSTERSTSFMSVQIATLTSPLTAPAPISINKTQVTSTGEVRSKKEPPGRKDPNSSASLSSGFAPPPAEKLPAPTSAETAAEPSVSAFPRPRLENTERTAGTTDLYPRTLNRTDVIEEASQEATQTLKSTAASESTSSSTLPQRATARTTARTTPRGHPAVPPLLSSSATPTPVSASPPSSNPNAVTNNVATPLFRRKTNTMFQPPEPSSRNANPQQLAAEVTTSPKAHLNAKFTFGTTYFIYSSLVPFTPMPALTTFKPQNSKSSPSLRSENHFWNKSYLEMAPKGKKPGVSMLPTPGLPEDNTHASHWALQKTAKSGSDKTPAQKTTAPELLPFEPLSRNVFERPRILGGKAASFTVPANSDAFLPCEAVGNPLPTIHWTRVSLGI